MAKGDQTAPGRRKAGDLSGCIKRRIRKVILNELEA
jgi:hypothetical protein